MHFLFTAPRLHTNQHYPAKALLDAGHEVTFVVLRRGPNETYEAVEPVVLGCSHAFDIARRFAALLPGVAYSDVGGVPPVRRFWSVMRNSRPSAVVVRDPRSAYGLLAMIAATLLGIRIILYSQVPTHAGTNILRRVLLRILSRGTGANWYTPIVGSTAGRPANGTLRYVPFVTPSRTAPDNRRWFREGRVNILAIGKFVRRKNHILFLDAISKLSGSHEIRATIVGECSTEEHRRELERVRRHCRHLGLEERVDIELNLSFTEVQRRYADHDVFVLASRDEPAAVSPLEAMANSLPVVCSDSNGTSCYLRHGANGYVFRTDDLDDLVACLDRLMADKGRLIEMGRRSYELVLSEHDPSQYVDALVAMASRS